MRLPEEKQIESCGDELLRLGIVMIVFVVLLNFIAIGLLHRSERLLGTNLADSKWRLLESSTEDVDWLILGDSSCNQGLDPSVVAGRLGGKALNLCTTGDMLAIDDVWMLQRYLESHPPPSGVFIVHVYDMWHRDASKLANSIWKLTVPQGHWSSSEPRLEFTVHQRFLNAVGRWIPLYSRAKSLKLLVTRAPFMTGQGRGALDSLGFEARNRAEPEIVKTDLENHKKWLNVNVFAMSSENQKALGLLGDLSDKYELPIYLVPGPIVDELAIEPSYQDYVAALDLALAKYTARHALLKQVPRGRSFPASMLENVDHLADEGPRIFTRFVTDNVEHP